ncbi:MAG: adenylate/guanylate cyclase domain-containing protein [Chitinophagales bacterium]
MSQSRQLAAIMFTDIVGYTALMGSNEQKAFELLNKNRQIQKPIIERFHGRWIKELGDGVMASFSTVTDAVLCATEIQNACEAIDGLKLRIGIHQGEVIFEDNDVFGDTVNIASRLQALAPIGGIWISESVYKNISNNKDIRTKYVREEVLKNVKEPVRIYEVLTKDAINIIDATVKKEVPARVRKSVAVLPFVNMSNDPEQEYFSDGVAEEILNSLAHIKDLKVAGRTSSFQFKGKNIDLREMGDKLGVSTVLEGSVRKQGNRLRITSQLISVADGFNLWSEKFDRQMDDIFAIQDEIALAITENLKVILLEPEKAIIGRASTENKIAYELYLRGRYEWGKRTKDGLLKSIDYFREAIAEDSQYSLAYAGMADSYTLLCAYHILSPEVSITEAKKAADRAMELNPMLAEAHEAVGHIDLLNGQHWKNAEAHYQKAIQLNPGFSTARQRYALMLATRGKFSEALAEIEKAIELDPLSKIINTDAGLIHFIMGQHDLAVKNCRKVLEMDPAFSVALLVQGWTYQQNEETEAARNSFIKAVEASNSSTIARAALACAMAKENSESSLKMLEELQNEAAKQFVSPYSIASIYAALGNSDEAFHWLNKAVDTNSVWIIHLHFSADPRFNEYKSDPRYAELLKRINLADG